MIEIIMMLLGLELHTHTQHAEAHLPSKMNCDPNKPPLKISALFSKYFGAFVNLRDIMSKLKLRVTNHD
jgi:hypothetical protein